MATRRAALLPQSSTWAHPHPVICLQRLTVINVNRNTQLWVIGIDHRGASVALQVVDFKPRFFVRAPTEWDEDDGDATDLLDEFSKMLHDRREPGTYEVDLVRSTPLLGFIHNDTERMIQVVSASIGDHRRAVKILKDQNYSLLHDDFSFQLQFIHRTSISYEQWMECTDVVLRTPHAGDRLAVNLTGTIRMKQCKRLLIPPPSRIPSALMAFIRVEACSRDGIATKRFAFRANASLPCDRSVAIAISYVWAHDPSSTPVSRSMLSLISDGQDDTQVFATETELLRAFRKDLLAHDPDELYTFPDVRNDLIFILERMETLGITEEMKLNRFQTSPTTFKKDPAGKINGIRFPDRNIMEMDLTLKSKPWIPIESYDLHTCCTMKKPDFELLKNPIPKEALIGSPDLVNEWYVSAATRPLILKKLRQDVELLTILQRDQVLRTEFTNLGQICETDLTDIVGRGQQHRVFQRLTHFCVDHHVHINDDLLSAKALRFNIRERPPTYPDAPSLPLNNELRRQANEKFAALLPPPKKRKVKPGTKPKEAKQLEGGSVLDPAPQFYGDEPVAVLDFNSLYPSIMMAFGICPTNLVYNAKYMDLPGVEYIFVAVNAYETVAFAKRPGLIPKLLKLLVDSRTDIRAKIKTEPDKFIQAVYDKMQLAMKTVCNATYGFFGAGGSDALFAVKDIMYAVTSIGRYLQRQCVYHLGVTYQVPTVYGDTDSVFVIAPLIHANTIEELADWARVQYRMGDDFSWQTVVQHFKKLDLSQWTLRQKRHALLYLIFERLSAECTTLFPPPIVLGFENLLLQLALYDKKKTYYGLILDEENPSRIKLKKPMKVTGMAMKKRDWCKFTREILTQVADMIAFQRFAEIKPFLDDRVEKLVSGKVPMEQLVVTKRYNGIDAYKSLNGVHLQLAQKLEQRRRVQIPPKTRIPFLVLQGKEKLYHRGEEPEVVQRDGLKLDLHYYLKKQIEKPLRKQLVFHPQLFNLDSFFKDAEQRIVADRDGLTLGVRRSLADVRQLAKKAKVE